MARISLTIALVALALANCTSSTGTNGEFTDNETLDDAQGMWTYNRVAERTLVPQSFVDASDVVVEDFLPRSAECPINRSRIYRSRVPTNGTYLYVVRIAVDYGGETAHKGPVAALRSCALESLRFVFNTYTDADDVFVRSVPQILKVGDHDLPQRIVFSMHTNAKSGYETSWERLHGDEIEDAPVEEFIDEDFETIFGFYGSFFGSLRDATAAAGGRSEFSFDYWTEQLDAVFVHNDIDEDASFWMAHWVENQLRSLSENGVDVSVSGLPRIVSAATLISDYESNEIRADIQYGGKQIWISGQIDSVSRNVIGSGAYVVLTSGNAYDFRSVQCFFDETHLAELQSYSKGDRVFVRGNVTGLMMNVTVDAVAIRPN